MTPKRMAPLAGAGELGADFSRYDALAERCRDDPELRERLAAGDTAEALDELGVDVPRGTEVRFVANTPGTFHLVMPENPNAALSDENLQDVAGGSSLSSALCFGSAGSFPSCVSSVATASTGGSVNVN